MKYWKGKAGTNKEMQFGTMENNGSVPDADECTKTEYEDWVASIPIPVKTKTDIDKVVEYAKAQNWI